MFFYYKNDQFDVFSLQNPVFQDFFPKETMGFPHLSVCLSWGNSHQISSNSHSNPMKPETKSHQIPDPTGVPGP